MVVVTSALISWRQWRLSKFTFTITHTPPGRENELTIKKIKGAKTHISVIHSFKARVNPYRSATSKPNAFAATCIALNIKRKIFFVDYLGKRMAQPNFANARSIRNALDRMRLRQANRLFARMGTPLTQSD